MPRLTTLSRSIAGRAALVTGAASGMGRATAQLFADEGAHVAVTSGCGQGFPDLVCSFRGRWYLLECKDGTLSPSARERALAHVAGCPRCRAELDDERGVRALLAEVSMPDVPAALLASLTAIPDRPVPLPTPGLVPPPPAVAFSSWSMSAASTLRSAITLSRVTRSGAAPVTQSLAFMWHHLSVW